MAPGYLPDTHTPPRQIRIGDQWYEFQAALELMGETPVGGGSARAENLRAYLDWFLHKEGAAMPTRPPADLVPKIKRRARQIKKEAEENAKARSAARRKA
ncbi:hypothetical protein [Streptomyces nogalater]|uniref:Uncharacterized protein n=1 Tax=Streptomyces nogalater TaxID=38314 RepID=A0ABW0WBQ6_STRNO